MSSIASSVALGISLAIASGSDDTAARNQLKSILKEDTKRLFQVNTGGISTSGLGIMLTALSSVNAERWGKYPGLRSLNPRMVLLVKKNITDIAIVTGAVGIDSYFDAGAIEGMRRKGEEIAEYAADRIFDSVAWLQHQATQS